MFTSSKEASVPKDIAQKIGLHYRSVEIHIENIRKNLNVRKTVEILRVTCLTEGDFNNIRLTPRHTEIFNLLLHGSTIVEIASRLGVKASTITRHRENMLLYNECNTMLELVSKYYGQHIAPKFLEKTDAQI